MANQNYLSEDEVQMLIKNNDVVQNGILNALGIDHGESADIHFYDEDEYINGITADFTLTIDNNITAIIECKSGNINVTDYVRGIGQLYQYEYFFEKKVPHKSFEYAPEASTIYFYPSSVIKKNSFNIANFKYPESMIIMELNEENNAVRIIDDNELEKIQLADDNLIAISPYYFRDNRLFEYYILLKYLLHKKNMGYDNCDRKEIEKFLKKTDTINNGNWRNAFITLANLGLINKKNIPTLAGSKMAILDYESFAYKMYRSYMQPYFEELYSIFVDDKMEITNQDICAKVRENNGGKDVLYLTQSNGRYVSSWLNIMRDDYGIINFKGGADKILDQNKINNRRSRICIPTKKGLKP